MTIQQTGILKERASRLKVAKKIGEIVGGRFLLAGGALTKDDSPKDFDIYGVDEPLGITTIEWRLLNDMSIGGYLSRTRNAITTRIFGQVVQFCVYHKPTPQKTVEAFDFAHCMAGAVFSASGEVMEVVATPDFWQSEEAGTTWYTGSEYPLSSLMRCMKFHKRGLFGKEGHKPAAMRILYDIVERGFKDYGDFQDQCASISESFRAYNCAEADDLFVLLERKGGGDGK